MVTEKEFLEIIEDVSNIFIKANGHHECEEVEAMNDLLEVFNLYNESNCDYNYIELELKDSVWLCLRYDGKNDLCFNFYDANQSQTFFAFPEEVTNDWDGASLIVFEFEKLLECWY